MRKRIFIFSILSLLLAFIGGCGGSGHHTSTENEVPVVVSVSDQPPTGISVVSFDVTISGACLLTSSQSTATSCSGAQNILPNPPYTVELSGLQNPQESDVLTPTPVEVQAGTYSAVLITFSSATTAINLDPGQTYTDGSGNTCANTGTTPIVCNNLVPEIPASVNVPINATLTSGQATDIAIDFNVGNSLTANAGVLSITPSVTVTTNSTAAASGNLIDAAGTSNCATTEGVCVAQVTGPVTNVSSTGLTLTDSTTGQPVTVSTGGNTTFNGYSTNCAANNLTCVANNQIVTVGYSISDANPPTLTATSISDNNGFGFGTTFEGTVVSTSPTPEVVVTAVPAGNTQGITVGEVLTLAPTGTAVFSTSAGTGVTLPGTFAGAGDLVVGQNLLVDSTGVVTASGVNTATADAIELEPTQFFGNASNIGTAGTGDFTVGGTNSGLNGLYLDNGINNIQVQNANNALYGGTITGYSGLTAGSPYYYNGYLMNSGTAGSPFFYDTSVYGGTATTPATTAVK